MTQVTAEIAALVSMTVPLCDIGIAPENPRADLPADDDIPNLAQTLVTDDGAGQLVPLFVRKGKKKENIWMALDGRRRLLAFAYLLENGLIQNDHPVRIIVCETKEQQARATVILNSERAQPHPADKIEAIAKLLQKKMSPGDIGRALNYSTAELNKLLRLATVHPRVLEAYRADKLRENQVKLLARLDDKNAQKEQADRAFDYGWIDETRVMAQIRGDKTLITDARFTVVTLQDYLDAGGRVERDLFGEHADSIIDSEILEALWQGHAKDVAAAITGKYGVETYVAGGDRAAVIPETMEATRSYIDSYAVASDLKAEFNSERAVVSAFETELNAAIADGAYDPNRVVEYLFAYASLHTYSSVRREIGAITITPDKATGFKPLVALKPFVPVPKTEEEMQAEAEAAEAKQRQDEAKSAYTVVTHDRIATPKMKVDTEGLNNSLHERRTDVSTKALMRDLADDPQAAIIVLAARLLVDTVTHAHQGDSAARISCKPYESRFEVIPALDGEIRIRVRAWKDAFVASGQRPITFVAGLAMGDRLQMMADLVALSLDLREHATHSVNSSRRAEAAEIKTLIVQDLAQHWTPDEQFLSAHPKSLLMAMAQDLELDTTALAKCKKRELVLQIAQAAAEKRYVPKGLDWSDEVVEAVASDLDDELDDEDGDDAGDEDGQSVLVDDDGEDAFEPANDQPDSDDGVRFDDDLSDEMDDDGRHFAVDDDIAA